MSLVAGIVIAVAIVGIVLAVVGICTAFGAVAMMMDDHMNGSKVVPERIPYSERTVQGGKLEPYYAERLRKENKDV